MLNYICLIVKKGLCMDLEDKKDMITGTQLSKELNVTGSRVSQVIAKLGLKDNLIKQGNKKLITKEDADKVREYFISTSEERATYGNSDNTQGLETVIKELSSQVKDLNKQLEAKDVQIEKAYQIADQSQRLQSDLQIKLNEFKLSIENNSVKDTSKDDLEEVKKQLEEERTNRNRLQEELNKERSKGFIKRLFG